MEESLTTFAQERSVLITGATGFLGRYAVREFQAHGYDIVAAGRNPEALKALQAQGIRTVQSSLAGLSSIDITPDTVVHAAALSSPWGKWQDFYEDNVTGTQHVVDFCARNAVRRLVYVSSPSIYSGRGHRLNIAEADFDPSNRLNHYIRSKILAEQMLQSAYARGTIPELTVIRPRGLIGIGDPSLIPRLLKANEKTGIPLFNNGQNLVDLTCVENAAVALRLAADAPRSDGCVYNITNGEPRRFKSILDQFFAEIGTVPHYRKANLNLIYGIARALEAAYSLGGTATEPPLTRYTVSTLAFSQTLDISKAKKELGYAPIVSLDTGIKNYAAQYRSDHA